MTQHALAESFDAFGESIHALAEYFACDAPIACTRSPVSREMLFDSIGGLDRVIPWAQRVDRCTRAIICVHAREHFGFRTAIATAHGAPELVGQTLPDLAVMDC